MMSTALFDIEEELNKLPVKPGVYLMHDRIDGRTAVPMAMVALLPFIRFLVLSNHAYIHFFITYRALMPTLAVFIYFVYDNAVRHMLSGIVRR